MKQRVIHNRTEFDKAVSDLAKYETYPYVMTVTAGSKIRTDGQNRLYWAGLNEYLDQMNHFIQQVEDAGYTNLEARKTIAQSLPMGHSAILYAPTAETVHAIIKLICGIPTSTKLGTSEFSKFRDIMEQTLAEIIGEINGVVR